MKTAIITFFDSFPPKTGSGVVCTDFFECWPDQNKRLFQLSTIKIKHKKIETIKLYKNKPIFKIISIPNIIIKLAKYFKDEKKKFIIIEGPSWIFYSFIIIFFFKTFYKNINIIYRSHSVEYEIRKNNSNLFIQYLTKAFENYVINNSDIATSVSSLEKNIFKKYYKAKTYLFPNSVDFKRLECLKMEKIKKIPKKFILFCGSYDYKPNKYAIDFIEKKILPKIEKKNIYLVLTGNHKKKFKNKNIINLGFVNNKKLKYLHYKSVCLFTPLKEGYGTRIKILEALVHKNRIITTKKGIEGISFSSNKNIKVLENKNKMIKLIEKFSTEKKVFKSNKNLFHYSMRSNCKRLFNFISKI
tara:strand:- start:137 stop:1207 length:1071 start_codon:yes stop_codon:yes gene_type:complete